MWKKSLLTFFLCLPAWGFEITKDFANGFYWATLPVNITVIDNDPARKGVIERISLKAIAEWENMTGLTLWSYKDGGTSNIIRWSTKFAAETRMDPMSVLAVAIRYTSGPYFAKTEIVINGSHPLNQDLNHLLTTLTHELGHTMGLDHSNDIWAVMAPSLQDPYRGLASDDREGMHHVTAVTTRRQYERYVSPLAYNEETKDSSPLSCGTVGVVGGASHHGLLSLSLGMLLGFFKRIFKGLRNWLSKF